jgi:hypothetical protein
MLGDSTYFFGIFGVKIGGYWNSDENFVRRLPLRFLGLVSSGSFHFQCSVLSLFLSLLVNFI